jgi:hypothetical protein
MVDNQSNLQYMIQYVFDSLSTARTDCNRVEMVVVELIMRSVQNKDHL